MGTGKKIVLSVITILLLIALLGGGGYLAVTWLIPTMHYRQAEQLLQEEKYDEAAAAFLELGEFQGAAERVPLILYQKALHLRDEKQYEEAILQFEELGDFTPGSARIGNGLPAAVQADETRLEVIRSEIEAEHYDEALELLDQLGDYMSRLTSAGTPGSTTDDLRTQIAVARAKRLVTIGKLEDGAEKLLEVTEVEEPVRILGNIGLELGLEISDRTWQDYRELLQEIRYRQAGSALLLSDFDTAEKYLEMAGDYENAEELLANAKQAFDLVYMAHYADGSGNISPIATSYLWIHSRISPNGDPVSIVMEEDFSTSDVDLRFFGAGTKIYSQRRQEGEYIFTFAYEGSEMESEQDRETHLVAAFSPDYTLINTKKIFADTAEDIEFPSSRNWKIVTDEELADTVRDGFRKRRELDLARSGYLAFADATDDPAIAHYCCEKDCLNVGTHCVSDATSRRYYCDEHYTGE